MSHLHACALTDYHAHRYSALHRQLLDFSPDGMRALPASKRQYLVVGGFGAQGLGNRLQWMTTFFWLALITNRAVLFEDDPKLTNSYP